MKDYNFLQQEKRAEPTESNLERKAETLVTSPRNVLPINNNGKFKFCLKWGKNVNTDNSDVKGSVTALCQDTSASSVTEEFNFSWGSGKCTLAIPEDFKLQVEDVMQITPEGLESDSNQPPIPLLEECATEHNFSENEGLQATFHSCECSKSNWDCEKKEVKQKHIFKSRQSVEHANATVLHKKLEASKKNLFFKVMFEKNPRIHSLTDNGAAGRIPKFGKTDGVGKKSTTSEKSALKNQVSLCRTEVGNQQCNETLKPGVSTFIRDVSVCANRMQLTDQTGNCIQSKGTILLSGNCCKKCIEKFKREKANNRQGACEATTSAMTSIGTQTTVNLKEIHSKRNVEIEAFVDKPWSVEQYESPVGPLEILGSLANESQFVGAYTKTMCNMERAARKLFCEGTQVEKKKAERENTKCRKSDIGKMGLLGSEFKKNLQQPVPKREIRNSLNLNKNAKELQVNEIVDNNINPPKLSTFDSDDVEYLGINLACPEIDCFENKPEGERNEIPPDDICQFEKLEQHPSCHVSKTMKEKLSQHSLIVNLSEQRVRLISYDGVRNKREGSSQSEYEHLMIHRQAGKKAVASQQTNETGNEEYISKPIHSDVKYVENCSKSITSGSSEQHITKKTLKQVKTFKLHKQHTSTREMINFSSVCQDIDKNLQQEKEVNHPGKNSNVLAENLKLQQRTQAKFKGHKHTRNKSEQSSEGGINRGDNGGKSKCHDLKHHKGFAKCRKTCRNIKEQRNSSKLRKPLEKIHTETSDGGHQSPLEYIGKGIRSTKKNTGLKPEGIKLHSLDMKQISKACFDETQTEMLYHTETITAGHNRILTNRKFKKAGPDITQSEKPAERVQRRASAQTDAGYQEKRNAKPKLQRKSGILHRLGNVYENIMLHKRRASPSETSRQDPENQLNQSEVSNLPHSCTGNETEEILNKPCKVEPSHSILEKNDNRGNPKVTAVQKFKKVGPDITQSEKPAERVQRRASAQTDAGYQEKRNAKPKLERKSGILHRLGNVYENIMLHKRRASPSETSRQDPENQLNQSEVSNLPRSCTGNETEEILNKPCKVEPSHSILDMNDNRGNPKVAAVHSIQSAEVLTDRKLRYRPEIIYSSIPVAKPAKKKLRYREPEIVYSSIPVTNPAERNVRYRGPEIVYSSISVAKPAKRNVRYRGPEIVYSSISVAKPAKGVKGQTSAEKDAVYQEEKDVKSKLKSESRLLNWHDNVCKNVELHEQTASPIKTSQQDRETVVLNPRDNEAGEILKPCDDEPLQDNLHLRNSDHGNTAGGKNPSKQMELSHRSKSVLLVACEDTESVKQVVIKKPYFLSTEQAISKSDAKYQTSGRESACVVKLEDLSQPCKSFPEEVNSLTSSGSHMEQDVCELLGALKRPRVILKRLSHEDIVTIQSSNTQSIPRSRNVRQKGHKKRTFSKTLNSKQQIVRKTVVVPKGLETVKTRLQRLKYNQAYNPVTEREAVVLTEREKATSKKSDSFGSEILVKKEFDYKSSSLLKSVSQSADHSCAETEKEHAVKTKQAKVIHFTDLNPVVRLERLNISPSLNKGTDKPHECKEAGSGVSGKLCSLTINKRSILGSSRLQDLSYAKVLKKNKCYKSFCPPALAINHSKCIVQLTRVRTKVDQRCHLVPDSTPTKKRASSAKCKTSRHTRPKSAGAFKPRKSQSRVVSESFRSKCRFEQPKVFLEKFIIEPV